MSAPNVTLMCLWRNDAQRNLVARANHLLEKQGVTRWVWVVGDSGDETETILRELAANRPVTVIRHDTNIPGTDPESRMQRLGETGNAGFDAVTAQDDYWLIHESDLQSPVDLVPQLLATGKDVIAGWVTLFDMFYDIYAYCANGATFINSWPYHEVYRPDALFEVDSVGSVMLFPASELRAGVRFHRRGVRDICHQMKARGLHVWVDPRIPIVQPGELWEAQVAPA